MDSVGDLELKGLPEPVPAMRALEAMADVEKTSIFGTAVHAVLRSPDVDPALIVSRLDVGICREGACQGEDDDPARREKRVDSAHESICSPRDATRAGSIEDCGGATESSLTASLNTTTTTLIFSCTAVESSTAL